MPAHPYHRQWRTRTIDLDDMLLYRRTPGASARPAQPHQSSVISSNTDLEDRLFSRTGAGRGRPARETETRSDNFLRINVAPGTRQIGWRG